MRIKKSMIPTLSVLNHYVMIRLPEKVLNDSIEISGTKLYLYPEYEVKKNTKTYGEVIKVPPPQKKKFLKNGPEWHYDVDIQPGDIVYMDYYAVLHHMGQKATSIIEYSNPSWMIDEDDRLYVFIGYHDLYFALRKPSFPINNEKKEFNKWFYETAKVNIHYKQINGVLTPTTFTPVLPTKVPEIEIFQNEGYEMIMLNSYVLAMAANEEIKSLIHLQDVAKKRKSPKYALVIRDNGKDNIDYQWPKRFVDGSGVKPLDIVAYQDYGFFPVEDYLHHNLNFRGANIGVIQKRYIDAVIEVDNHFGEYYE